MEASGRRLQRVCFPYPSPSRISQAEREAKKGSDNDADHKRKKDYDGKRRAEFPRKKRDRDQRCILNGKNDNGCYNKGCYTENKHGRPPYSSLWLVPPFIRPQAHHTVELRGKATKPSLPHALR
jgi:hypothetical protein